MKRLLIALAAVVGALGSFSALAADSTLPTGTGFDTLTANAALDTGTTDAPADYWSPWTANEGESLTVKAWDGSDKTFVGDRPAVPDQETSAGATNFLDLDMLISKGNCLYRNINADSTPYAMSNVDTDGSIFIDTLVKFTTADSDEYSVPDDTKLAIYLKEITASSTEESDEDEVLSTNLIVRAGTYDTTGNLASFSYDCGAFKDPEDWHRLTVRAIKGAYGASIGFVVYVDTTAIGFLETSTDGTSQATGYVDASLSSLARSYNQYNYLFPSLIPSSGSNGQCLTGIGFAGKGSVDDIVFQTEVPFDSAKDNFVTLGWDDTLASLSYTKDGNTVTIPSADLATAGSVSIISDVSGAQVTVEVTYKNGYGAGTWVIGDDASVDGSTINYSSTSANATVTIVGKKTTTDYEVTIGDATTKCADFGEVLTAINAEGVTSATIKLLNDVEIGRKEADGAEETEALFTEKDITIDLAGKTISGPTDGESADSEDNPNYYVICVEGGSLTIKDSSAEASGKIVANIAQGVVYVMSIDMTAAKLTIEGGTFDGKIYVDATSGDDYVAATASLTGGSYLASDNSTKTEGQDVAFSLADYVAENYAAALDETSAYWVVSEGQEETPVAKIGTTGYTTLQQAIDAAIEAASSADESSDPVVVEICSDITLSETLTIAAEDATKVAFTINTPKDYTVMSAPTATGVPGVTIDGVTLTFKGEGAWTKTVGNKTFFCVGETTASANVIVESGTFTATASGHVMTAQNGLITVNGGTFETSGENAGDRYCVRSEMSELKSLSSGYGVIVVNGGTFTNPTNATKPPVGVKDAKSLAAGAAAYINVNGTAKFAGNETQICGTMEDYLVTIEGDGDSGDVTYTDVSEDWKFKLIDGYYVATEIEWSAIKVTWDENLTSWAGNDGEGEDDAESWTKQDGEIQTEAVFKYDIDDAPVTFAITNTTFATGYELDSDTSELSVDLPTTANVTNEITIVSKQTQAVKPLDPTDAAGTTYDSAEDATKAAEAFNEALKTNPELIEVPDVVTNEEDKAAYRALFKAVADGTTVKLDFTSDAKEDLANAAETAVESIELQAFAASDGSSEQNLLTVKKAIPGLWYTLLTGTDTPANLPTAHSQQAETSEVKFNVTKDADTDRAFFRMKITTTKVMSTGLTN